mmetsp:Transcript_10514/g.16127  ORF Transcript_10514/g.16127 Transcript_10514/m.16127 type:complete len:172 (-) Transcript_10514:1408-1923(-)
MKLPMATSALLALKPGLPAMVLGPEVAKRMPKQKAINATDLEAGAATLVRPLVNEEFNKDAKHHGEGGGDATISSSTTSKEWIVRLPKTAKQLRKAYQLLYVSPENIQPIQLNNTKDAETIHRVENLLDGSLFPSSSIGGNKESHVDDNAGGYHHRTKAIKINADFVTCTQ